MPNQPTTLSQMGMMGGWLGLVGVPSMVKMPETAAPISSKPGRLTRAFFAVKDVVVRGSALLLRRKTSSASRPCCFKNPGRYWRRIHRRAGAVD